MYIVHTCLICFNYRRLLNEVVRLKVHSEETFSRLNKEKGDDVINVR